MKIKHLKMKLSVFLTFFCVMQITAATGFGQERINIDVKNASLDEILEEIKVQTDYRFFFEKGVINLSRKMSLKVRNETVENVLGEMFSDSPISFTILKDQIVFTRKPPERLKILEPSKGLRPLPLRRVMRPVTVNLLLTIIGKVTDRSGDPLIGVNIQVKGTTRGTVTDFDGGYSIDAGEDDVLIFSYVGYQTQELDVNGQTEISIQMMEDAETLDELVVVGYGVQKKSDLTGAVSQVKTEALEAVPSYNVEQALKSQAAGVTVRQNSGTPGGRIEVRIRGGNSMIGSNQPLYVVDGFPITGDISFLNPSDIESIDILKDASATAIYGARGANGVVMISTKKGSTNQKSKIEIHSQYGIQFETNRYEMLNARQYAEVANEWLVNSGQEPYFDLNEVQGPGTNWQDFIFRDAPLNNHTLTFSGGTSKTRFALSGNYFGQNGIIKYSGVEKGSFRLNLDHKFSDKIRWAVNTNLARRERESVPVDNSAHGGSMLSGAMAAPPTLPIYDEEGGIVRISQVYSFGSIGMENPAIYFPPRKNNVLNNTVLGNTSVNVDLTNEISFKTLIGIEYDDQSGDDYIPIVYDGDIGSGAQSSYTQNSFLTENILTYSKNINENHNFKLLGGFTYQTYKARSFSASVRGFSNNITENYNLGSAEIINNPISGYSEWTLASWLSRLNYSFNDKYLLTASIRGDGSSRFGKNNKWGLFPSGAFAWRVTEESFMQNIKFINYLKIRTSYGVTGNTAVSPYQSLNRLSAERVVYGNHTEEIGFAPAGIANSDLKWESTTQFDVGFDIEMVDERLKLTFDYYKKSTSDLLASVPLPPSIGFTSSLQNIGKIQNQGIELSLGADILRTEFKWDISTQFSVNRNEVVELAGGADIYGGGVGIFGNISLAREGEPLGVFYGFVENGLNEEGYIKYVDLNNDGEINIQDRTIIGNPYPDFIYGLTSNFSYKNFDLSIFLEGVNGNNLWWATAATHLNSFQRGSNQFADLYGNYWTAENPNPNAKYPKVSSSSQISDSDRFVKNGSYFRMKSMRLAYNISVKKFVERAQIYFLCTNLFTVTSYPGIDPDVNTAGTDSNNIENRLTTGVDESAYPMSKVFSVGVRFNF
ncbi:TonB-dependent receptor [Membranihabitans maritimus]|uniref:TonB-dependent receptor n=1 Tax=Membranihabitans maritimus TaxID=2904244 RepID=UPI001F433328|nr:TonB-dependent receptor [Membranihabitans maritimus]